MGKRVASHIKNPVSTFGSSLSRNSRGWTLKDSQNFLQALLAALLKDL